MIDAVDLQPLAEALASARLTQTQTAADPFTAVATVEQAYQLQQLASQHYPSPRIGYKIGATSEAAQKIIGCDGPFTGPMFERDCYRSGCQLELIPAFVGGEAEFAFEIGNDFPAQAEISAEQLIPLIANCHIAVEIVGRRTDAAGLPGLLMAISDFGANAAFIAGPTIPHWSSMDLTAIAVSARIDGEVTNTGTAADVLGSPLNALIWLHCALFQRGERLRAGDIVSTGTCLGVIEARAGSTVEVEFSGCGSIEYRLT